MLNSITAKHTMERQKEAMMKDPDAKQVEANKREVIAKINKWKIDPERFTECSAALRSNAFPNMPNDAFYVGLKKELETTGFVCLLDRSKSDFFQVSLPNPVEPVVAVEPKSAEPNLAATANDKQENVDVVCSAIKDQNAGLHFITHDEVMKVSRHPDSGNMIVAPASAKPIPTATEAADAAFPGLRTACQTTVSSLDQAIGRRDRAVNRMLNEPVPAPAPKEKNPRDNQMANKEMSAIKDMRLVLKKVNQLLAAEQGFERDDFAMSYTLTAMDNLIVLGLTMLAPIVTELHDAGWMSSPAIPAAGCGLPTIRSGDGFAKKRDVLAICTSLSAVSIASPDALYMALWMMHDMKTACDNAQPTA